MRGVGYKKVEITTINVFHGVCFIKFLDERPSMALNKNFYYFSGKISHKPVFFMGARGKQQMSFFSKR